MSHSFFITRYFSRSNSSNYFSAESWQSHTKPPNNDSNRILLSHVRSLRPCSSQTAQPHQNCHSSSPKPYQLSSYGKFEWNYQCSWWTRKTILGSQTILGIIRSLDNFINGLELQDLHKQVQRFPHDISSYHPWHLRTPLAARKILVYRISLRLAKALLPLFFPTWPSLKSWLSVLRRLAVPVKCWRRTDRQP